MNYNQLQNGYGNQNNYKAAPMHGRRSKLDNEQKFRDYTGIKCTKFSLGELVLEALRKKIVERAGSNCINHFAKRFDIMDDLGSKDGELTSYELHMGLKQVGIDFNKADCEELIKIVDTNNNGRVSFTEFIIALRGKINQRRMDLIDMAFMQLGPSPSQRGQVVTTATMMSKYDTSKHPDVISGKKSPQEVMREFMNIFDDNRDGVITMAEFRHYFKNVSATIGNDDEFELMIRNAWHLSGGSNSQVQNTSNLRVGVTFKDGRFEVIEIKNDLGLNRADPKAVKTALCRQGVHEIQKIHMSDALEM